MLILASASPRRRELLARLRVAFRVRPAGIDETPRAGERPEALASRLAVSKARATGSDGPILAADTVVAVDDEALGKPRDPDAAAAMLGRLSGREHRVVTVLVLRRGSAVDAVTVVTRVWFRPLGEAERRAYAALPEVRDAAGGYAIQKGAAAFVTRLVGSYSGVVGLPLAQTASLLRARGLNA